MPNEPTLQQRDITQDGRARALDPDAMRREAEEDMARAARKKMLEELRRAGKKGSFIVEDDDHDAVDADRAIRIAREFEQMDDQMADDMRKGGIVFATMDIEKDDAIVDEDGFVRHEMGEKEIGIEVIDMRLDEGLRDFLRDDIREDLFGKDAPARRGDVDRLTQCPNCGSTDIQVMAPPNMYCNSCDESYSYEMGMEDVEKQFGVEFKEQLKEEDQIIFGRESAGQKKIKRIFRPGEE